MQTATAQIALQIANEIAKNNDVNPKVVCRMVDQVFWIIKHNENLKETPVADRADLFHWKRGAVRALRAAAIEAKKEGGRDTRNYADAILALIGDPDTI